MKSAHDVSTELTVPFARRATVEGARAGSSRRDSSRADSALWGWGEVLALTLLAPLGIACVAPHDPLLLDAAFPWLVLVPLLLGAQHGALAGAASAALLVAVGVLHAGLAGGSVRPGLAAFGGGCAAIGVIAGFFRDRVQARLAQLGQESRESARRLSRLGRSHVVLELSHRRLEERLAARNWSIASAFRDAQRALAGGPSLATVGDVVLGVLSNHAFVQSATLVGATESNDGRYELRASTSFNGPRHVDLEHRLVQRALASGRLVALDAENVDLEADESIVAVAPLRSVGGRLLGLVLVHEMPFMAFQAENLENLAALTALLADMLEERFVDSVVRDEASEAATSEAATSDGMASEAATSDGMASDVIAREPAAEDMPRSGVRLRRGFVGTRSGTRRRFAQSA